MNARGRCRQVHSPDSFHSCPLLQTDRSQTIISIPNPKSYGGLFIRPLLVELFSVGY
jgi:hypothetical protein